MTLTDEELIQQWRDGEKRQRELWLEILNRKLYFQAQGIDTNKRDNSWRNPPSATKQSQMKFFSGVIRSPRGTTCRERKMTFSIDMADFE
jgi:hypothetical protein